MNRYLPVLLIALAFIIIVSTGIYVYPLKTEFSNELTTSDYIDYSKININKATVNELCGISGIGEQRANDIIEYRNNNGDFKSIIEIKKVKGIGESLFEEIKDEIYTEEVNYSEFDL